MITITISKIGDETLGTNQILGVVWSPESDILESSDNTTSGFAVVTLGMNLGINTGKKLTLTDTYATIKAAITSDLVLSGAETTANKATTFGTVNDTLYPSTEAVVENFAGRHYYVASGTDTYTATLVPATTPFAGMEVKLKFGITNTGAATFNAAAIKKGTAGTTALSASDLVITKIYTLIFDGTNWQINL
jgi:hypothetical protein